MQRVLAIARYTLFEARRTRLPVLLVLAVGVVFLIAAFAAELAVTESTRVHIAIYAAGMRLAAVFITGFCVLASVTREFNDKGLDVLLALDIPRSHYILGRLAGFVALGVLIAALACLPLAALAPPVAVLQWGFSLALELAVIGSLALFCVITFNQLTPAAAFVLAFYWLARSLAAMRLISAHPLSGAESWSHQVIVWLVEGLALVVPALENWTQTAWLVDAAGAWSTMARIGAEACVYVALLAAAAMFDFHRRNF
jgi:ABC-type transport system involved in multi-copper enzyme maturation permease subunit